MILPMLEDMWILTDNILSESLSKKPWEIKNNLKLGTHENRIS